MTEWLLVETFGDKVPSVIGVGSRPRRWGPLAKYRQAGVIEKAIAAAGSEELDQQFAGGRYRIMVHPLLSFAGARHGAWVWCALDSEQPPVHDPAGAWHFNLTTDEIGGSDDLLDLYRQPQSERHQQRRTAEAFTRLVTNDDVAAAFAVIVKSPVGAEHQAIWTVRCDDGAERAAHFSCRAVAIDDDVVLRGITHDIGPAATTAAAPGPVVLERRVMEAVAEPGTYQAFVNMRTGRLIRWEGAAPKHLDWTSLGQSLVHPDDTTKLDLLHKNIIEGRSEAGLRLRTTDGSWVLHRVVAYPVMLDSSTTAAFWTVREN